MLSRRLIFFEFRFHDRRKEQTVRVMDLTRSSSRLSVDIQAGTAFELLISLMAFGSTDLEAAPDVLPMWFDKDRTDVSPKLHSVLESLGARDAPQWGELVGFAASGPPEARDTAGFISFMERTPAMDLRLAVLGFHTSPLRERASAHSFIRAARGDPAAQEELLAASADYEMAYQKDGTAALRTLLSLGVEETKTLLLEAVRLWRDEVFEPHEQDVGSILARDADAKRALVGRVLPEKLIEIATNGLDYTPQPWARRVLLVPHLAMRPWNVLCAHDEVAIICYPVADESLGADPDAPPPRLVRLHKALGDEKRLRMLRLLAKRAADLHELANAAGLAKSSAHHHLVILRSAGLIRVTTGEQGRYSLRRDFIPEAAGWLPAFLERNPAR
jgi:DNA-binding transcriptional ArsR family regulator